MAMSSSMALELPYEPEIVPIPFDQASRQHISDNSHESGCAHGCAHTNAPRPITLNVRDCLHASYGQWMWIADMCQLEGIQLDMTRMILARRFAVGVNKRVCVFMCVPRRARSGLSKQLLLPKMHFYALQIYISVLLPLKRY